MCTAGVVFIPDSIYTCTTNLWCDGKEGHVSYQNHKENEDSIAGKENEVESSQYSIPIYSILNMCLL